VIITNDFVMLNFPKTGSSFARKRIKAVYAQSESKGRKLLERLRICSPVVQDVMLPKIDELGKGGLHDQHGTYRQIPFEHRQKPIVSIAREPVSRYESTYLYRWWEKHPPAELGVIRDRYPHFPDLSFSQYYEMVHHYGREARLQGVVPRIDLGLHTIQFIQFYFSDPVSVLKNIDDEYIDSSRFNHELKRIRFLHQENLESELNLFLHSVGVTAASAATTLPEQRVNVSPKSQEDSQQIGVELDGGIREEIANRDRLLYRIFPEYLALGNIAVR